MGHVGRFLVQHHTTQLSSSQASTFMRYFFICVVIVIYSWQNMGIELLYNQDEVMFFLVPS